MFGQTYNLLTKQLVAHDLGFKDKIKKNKAFNYLQGSHTIIPLPGQSSDLMVSHSLGLQTHFNPNVSEFNRNKQHKNNLIALDMLYDAVTTKPLTHLELSIFITNE